MTSLRHLLRRFWPGLRRRAEIERRLQDRPHTQAPLYPGAGSEVEQREE